MKSISILLLILLPTLGFGTNRYSRNQQNLTISIIPEIGGAAYYMQLESDDNKFYSGYNVGCNVELKPIKNFGLTSGFTYNKFFNSINYNEVPILINYFTKNDLIFSAGSVLYFDPNAKQYGNPDPSVGAAFGIKKANFGFIFYLNRNHPLISLNRDMKYAVGIGLKIDLFRFVLVKK
jgi:hypothetical protein